jgi:hypothetical protein
MANLQKYQDETKAWRDSKVKGREFNAGDLILLRSPRTESLKKLESKWVEPYVVVKKLRPGTYCLQILKAECWSTPGTQTIFVVILFNPNMQKLKIP